jgi:hypothetical protein
MAVLCSSKTPELEWQKMMPDSIPALMQRADSTDLTWGFIVLGSFPMASVFLAPSIPTAWFESDNARNDD